MVLRPFKNAIQSGERLADDVKSAAANLEELLRRIHGGKWSIDINHQAQFVAVSRNFWEDTQ